MYLLGSPTTCINMGGIAKQFQGNTVPGLVVGMRSVNVEQVLALSLSFCFSQTSFPAQER